MRNIGKMKKQCGSLFLAAILLTGCSGEKIGESPKAEKETSTIEQQMKPVAYEVEPEQFSLSIGNGGAKTTVSLSGKKRKVKNLVKEEEKTSWEYPDEKIAVSIQPKEDYLHVTITSKATEDNEFQWPKVSGKDYYMPFGEGKRIPQTDLAWKNYLKGKEFTTLEQLSMPFWAAADGEHAVLYIMENPYRNNMIFSDDDTIQFSLVHQYPKIDPEKSNSFRIYLTEDNPVSVAKIYRQYVKEQGKFVTLEQKAEKNSDIRKLYGAPQIYLWGENLIAAEDINWQSFVASISSSVSQHMIGLASQTETGEEAKTVWNAIANQDYVDQYQKNIVCRYLSEILKLKTFYNPQIFERQDQVMNKLLKKEIDKLDETSLIQLNKHALSQNLPDVFPSVDTWMNGNTIDLIKDLKKSGLDQAWIGLNSWEQAYAKPELVETAKRQGYLIGPYDSYHSIHKPGEEKWITAKFQDHSLYDNATVLLKNGKKAEGFQNVGRKLNPTLSLAAVEQRVKEILSSGIKFNSWFIDCDATGEIYDDYTPEHITTEQEDLNARLKRMEYIRDQHNMVIGSEGGYDFSAATIAFAHGIELPSFSWMDEDMKKNKSSEYYIGKYYSASGGVAEHFSKRIPIKEEYDTIFLNPKYDLPLFKLVYNDSVITSYHWDWSTFKIIGSVNDRMLREVLYNIPPLYHLDQAEWNKYKEDIINHSKLWSKFSKQAIKNEMTDFKYLLEDGSVQMSEYGDKLKVVANFSDTAYSYDGKKIPAHSLLLSMDGEVSIYTPKIAKANQ